MDRLISVFFFVKDSIRDSVIDGVTMMISGTSTVMTFTGTTLLTVPSGANESTELTIRLIESITKLIGVLSPFIWVMIKKKLSDKKDKNKG